MGQKISKRNHSSLISGHLDTMSEVKEVPLSEEWPESAKSEEMEAPRSEHQEECAVMDAASPVSDRSALGLSIGETSPVTEPLTNREPEDELDCDFEKVSALLRSKFSRLSSDSSADSLLFRTAKRLRLSDELVMIP